MKTMGFSRGIAWLATMILGAGCATIISGVNQPVTFNSNPDGASVILDGVTLGKTPTTIQVKRKGGQVLKFEKEGYKPVSVPLATTLNGWFLGNIILGGLVGSTTDGVSGAVYQYSPNQYMVSLESEGESEMGGRVTSSRSEKVKEYIVVTYEDLLKNLREGQGEHLESLLSLLEITEDMKADAVRSLQGLSEAYGSSIEFADEVLKKYVNEQGD